MKIAKGFNEREVERIARNCGSKRVRQSIAYLRRLHYYNPEKFYCEVLDDVCFFAGSFGKSTFRLCEIAVEETEQGKGWGKIMMLRIKTICQRNGVERITLRTAKGENAVWFYKKYGGKIIGEKDGDWEMEIRI